MMLTVQRGDRPIMHEGAGNGVLDAASSFEANYSPPYRLR